MNKLNKIAREIKSIKLEKTEKLEKRLLSLGWSDYNGYTCVFVSPCKKYIFKQNGLCYKKDKRFPSLYLPTVEIKIKGESYLLQKRCAGSGSYRTESLFRKRLEKTLYSKITKKQLWEKIKLNNDIEEFIEIDFHEDNVCIYKGKPVLHDW